RTAIFEIMQVNETIRRLIIENASTEDMIRTAREHGMKTLRENGIHAVLEGITSIEEILRASYEHE
ncbi:MAG: type II secretion system protein GspE, partial [Firmicutes bacterium]|nr:type II secretion system protein GspE [Candidatus Scybalomonas excrementavium]